MALWHLILHLSGSDNVSGKWYGFWSGFGGDLPIFGGLVAMLHKHNCHQPGCPRIGKHVYAGTPYCLKHHPKLGASK